MAQEKVSDERFASDFEIKSGHQYAWLFDYAQKQYELLDKCVDTIDSKISSLATLVSGYAIALGSAIVAGLMAEKVDPKICQWAMPSFVVSLISLWLMVWSRGSLLYQSPPTVRNCSRYADNYNDEATAKGAMIGSWHLAVEDVRKAMKKKACRLDWCVFFSCLSITLLGLPIWAAFKSKDAWFF